METLTRLVAFCGDGLHALSAGSLGLPLALLIAGLAGSVLHCVGMCGPFVLGQVMADTDLRRSLPYGEWERLKGAALLPYHLGRLTTYAALGAVAGGMTALFAATTEFAWLSVALLLLAALLMTAQALGIAFGGSLPLGGRIARLAAPLSGMQGAPARFGLGMLLGLLPCGLLYGAIAAAAGSGSVAGGALAMMAFGFGTVPSLVLVAWGGLAVRRRLQHNMRWVTPPLLAGNAMLMLGIALQRL